MADPLTPTEQYVVRRLKGKLGAMLHHVGDARSAAVTLRPQVMGACGFREQLALFESRLAELRAIIHGLPFEKKDEAAGG